MTILDDLTGDLTMRADRAEADKAVLSAAVREATRPAAGRAGHRSLVSLGTRGTIAGILVAGAVAGGATAAVVLSAQRPTVFDQARCYSEPSTDFGPSFPGTSAAVAQPAGSSATSTDVADQALEVCGAVWRQGLLRYGSPNAGGDGIPDHPVPSLVACVLPSGEAAVFPGDRSTCGALGLPLMAPEGSGAARTP